MTQTIEVRESEVPTAISLIEALEVGQILKAPVSRRKSLTVTISGTLKYRHGENRSWKTYVDPKDDQFFIIECLK